MLLNELPVTMLRCLGITILTEGLAGYLLGVRSVRGQAIVLLNNVMTNPLVVSLGVLCTYRFGRAGYWCGLPVLEAAAFAAEAAVYRKNAPCPRDPLLLSAVLNGCSFLTGLVWNLVFT
ncbi:MAG: hypothetical protein IJT44_09880 [Clostridia bacterium]|nr:hypothetical protein [Clostridia bacterium]